MDITENMEITAKTAEVLRLANMTNNSQHL